MPDLDTLAIDIVATCTTRGLTIATCESLTGGLLAARLTAIPGASLVVRGGLVTYATDLKRRLANVPEDVLADGVVTEATALAMARGARKTCRSDIGLATTGVAGPGPADAVAAGNVWIACATKEKTQTLFLTLSGNRDEVRAATVDNALKLLTSLLTTVM